MARLDQNTWHRVHPDSLPASRSSQDRFRFHLSGSRNAAGFVSGARGPEGQYLCRLRVTDGQQICLLVLFLLSCIISCL